MPPSQADALRAEIIEVGRRLYERGLITATEGNISVSCDGGLLVTAGGVSKGFLTPELVLRTDAEGRRTGVSPPLSSETPMHVAIYRRRPDVRAVVHAHPPWASAFAVARIPLDQPILAESVLLLGAVPLVPYAPPSTDELAELVGEAFASANAALLANHGAVAVGETLARAQQRMETLEHVARVMILARILGGASPLSAEQVELLMRLPGGPYR